MENWKKRGSGSGCLEMLWRVPVGNPVPSPGTRYALESGFSGFHRLSTSPQAGSLLFFGPNRGLERLALVARTRRAAR